MNLFLYRVLITLASPVFVFQAWKKCRKDSKQFEQNDNQKPIPGCFRSRFGFKTQPLKTEGILIHAASVGETRSIFPLLEELNKKYPGLPITLTNSSIQGYRHAEEFSPLQIQQQLLPFDYSFAANRLIKQLQPKLVIMVETEVWPNLYRACQQNKIPITLINARLKQSSFKSYQKWGGQLIAETLNSASLIAAQYPEDKDRFLQLGADEEKLETLGNLKSDIKIDTDLSEKAQQWRQNNSAESRPIWVASSTHKDPKGGKTEEQLLLEAHRELLKTQPNALLILVPRHASRFTEVAAQIQQEQFEWQKRSTKQNLNKNTQVYLADSLGEMMLWYSIADVAFVGGSLVKFGGHNILEAAALKKPIISGQHYANLQAMFKPFTETNAIQIVSDQKQLVVALNQLFGTPEVAAGYSNRALECFQKQSGALDRTIKAIAKLIEY